MLLQLSPLFKKNFQQLLNINAAKHPFETLPVLYPGNLRSLSLTLPLSFAFVPLAHNCCSGTVDCYEGEA